MSVIWSAFLPVGDGLKQDQPPVADPTWLAVRGVDPSAARVLQRVRQVVLPLMNRVDAAFKVEGFSLLVHDRTSGVPCPPEDHGAYLHLRLRFEVQVYRLGEFLGPSWIYLSDTSVSEARSKEGCDCVTAGSGACELLEWQSALYLRLVERAPTDDFEALKYVQQHLHFFANMSQMRIS